MCWEEGRRPDAYDVPGMDPQQAPLQFGKAGDRAGPYLKPKPSKRFLNFPT